MISPDFVHELRVRYADTDAQGHVYFANYLTYADEALSAWMRHLGLPQSAVTALGVDFVYADARVRYRSRAMFEDRVRIHVTPKHVGNTSLVTTFEVVRDGESLAVGELVQVCLAMPSREKVRIPDVIRSAVGQGPPAGAGPPQVVSEAGRS